MASNLKKTKLIRARKSKPNKSNLKADHKRYNDNIQALRELASKEKE